MGGRLALFALAALLALSGVAWAASWRDGSYKGKGARNLCIALKVSGSKVKRIVVKGAPDCAYRYRCTGALDRSAPPVTLQNLAIRPNGRFSRTVDEMREAPPGATPRGSAPSRGVRVVVRGRLNGGRARGTFSQTFSAGGEDRCESGRLGWKARHRR